MNFKTSKKKHEIHNTCLTEIDNKKNSSDILNIDPHGPRLSRFLIKRYKEQSEILEDDEDDLDNSLKHPE